MKTKRMLGILAMIVVVAACTSQDDGGASTAGTDGVGGAAIPIAIVADQTGVSSDLAIPGMAGIRSYIDALNERGGIDGREIEIVSVQDSQTTAEGAQRAFQSVLEENPVAVLGSVSSLGVSAVPPIAGPAGIPVLFNFAPDGLLIPPQPWLFTMAIPGAVQIDVILDHLDDTLGGLEGRRIAVASAVSGFGDGFVAAFEGAADERGYEVAIVDRHEVQMTSFVTNASRINGTDPDAIILMDVPSATPMIVNDLRAAGYEGPVIGYESAGEPAIISAVADPQYFSFRGAPIPEVDGAMAAAADAAGVSDRLASIWFSYGWTQGAILEDALRSCGPDCDGRSLIGAIEAISGFVPDGDSSYGPISFSADKHYAATGFQFVSWDEASSAEVLVGEPIISE